MSEELHPGLHPGADVLNAFLEGALAEHERTECLAHLADCAKCREVVFLAREAAAVEEPATVKELAVPLLRRLLRPMPAVAVAATAMMVFFSVRLYLMIRSAEPKPAVTASAELAAPAAKAAPETSTQTTSQAAPKKPAQPDGTVQSTRIQPALPQASPRPFRTEPLQPPVEAVPPPSLPVERQAVPSLTPAQATVVAGASPPAPPSAQFAAAPNVPVATGAGVAGTITDRTGAVIPRAQVELRNDSTGATYAAASDARGQFSIAGMAPGRYDLSVTSMGFQKFVRPSVEVQPQTIARIDSTLDVGAATETVTVTAEAPLLQTESGTVARTRKVPPATLRLNGRPATEIRTGLTYQLPGTKPAVTFAAKDRFVVAANAEGALFFSDNQGKSWKHIKRKWKGRVVRVVSPPSATGTNAVFELTTDPASTWVSADGRNWTAAPASR
jgi:hypothetical protein